MPQNRPKIPKEVERQILIEAGHRCAVCGTETPLERAHIIPWTRSKDHSADNLICLCANCHSRADKEDWGVETLRQYKQRPWVLRVRSGGADRATAISALHQLPAPPADFTGRESELAELLRAVEAGENTVLGIRGMGGIGKTALALKFAEKITPYYPDAQIYLDLQGVSSAPLSPAQAMTHVIRAFYPEVSLPKDESDIASFYRTVLHTRRTLLLLDNAAHRAQIEPLIPPIGNFLLVTSRFLFHLRGMTAKELKELPTSASRELLLRIEPRIGEQADRIAEICGGIPFALLQVAGALSERPDLLPVRYAQRLAEEKEKLGLIEASLSLSYDLLTQDQAFRWRVLAIFPLDFDISAARAVWDVEIEVAEAALSEFIRHSLLQGSEERYRLHDLARVFAESKLSSKERTIAGKRYSKFYLRVAYESAAAFMEGRSLEGLNRFDAEWVNIQNGFRRAAEASSSDESSANIVVLYTVACQPFLDLRIHPHEAFHWLEAALPLARRLGDRLFVVTILNQLGLRLRDVGRHREALASFREALEEAYGLDNSELSGSILGNIGNEQLFLGESEGAQISLEKALEIASECDDQHGVTVALGGLERLYFHLQDYPRAIEFAAQWLTVSRESGDRQSEGQALGNMGITYMYLGEIQKAVDCFLADLEITRELKDRQGEGACIGNLGWAAACLGKLEEAKSLLISRIELSQSISDLRGEAESSWVLGAIYEVEGDLARAVELLQVMVNYETSIQFPGAKERAAEVEALRSRAISTPDSGGQGLQDEDLVRAVMEKLLPVDLGNEG